MTDILRMIESRSFSIHNHTSNAFHVMHELRQRNELCDITILIENQEFHAHRVVLAGCSPYLRAMFTNGMLETDLSRVQIHGIESITMEVLLQFMYIGEIELTVDNVQSILQAASLFNISSLRAVCSNFLQIQLDYSNCLGIHHFADIYSCQELESVSRRFIYQHFLDVVRSDEFLSLAENKLIDLLKSDQLQVTCEEEVCDACLRWIEWDIINRSSSACTILQHVRLALLDLEYLENEVLQTEFVRSCPKCQNLVAKAVKLKNDKGKTGIMLVQRAQPQSIYVLGGRNALDCQLKSVERYDFLRDDWMVMGSMNISRTAVGAATLNGLLWAVGGECVLAETQADTVYLRSNECLDPVLKCWHARSDMKVPRSFVAVGAVGGYLYAIGGEDRFSSYNTVERYNLGTDDWTFMAPMQRKRAGAGIAVSDGKVYVAGGYDKSFHTDRASVECFDPEINRWTFVTEMEKARSGMALVAIGHHLYAFGGRSRHSDQYYDIAERYNTTTNQWTSIAALNTPRAWPAATVFDNKIFLIGGFDGMNRLNSVEMYDPLLDMWSFVSNMNISRAGCGCAVV